MLRFRAVAACAALVIGAAAGAAEGQDAGRHPAQISHAFGNTVLSRYPDGGWVKHWFDADGGYRAEFSSGRRIAARWRVEGRQVCLNGITPRIMMISRFCSEMPNGRVGETWSSRDPLGRRVVNELRPGR